MTDVIGEMLNDTSKDMRYKRIFIYDIDPCEYNMYPMQEIEELARNISECGLLHPITLYRKADGRYMILSGERRYRATVSYTHLMLVRSQFSIYSIYSIYSISPVVGTLWKRLRCWQLPLSFGVC